MGVTNPKWTFVIDTMIQSGHHQRTFDPFCSLFRWHWVAGWKTGVTLGRQPLAKSLSSLYLYKDPPVLPILSFPTTHDTRNHRILLTLNPLISVQVWSAFNVKGSHSYDLLLWLQMPCWSLLKKYFFQMMILAADFAFCWRWRTRASSAMAAQAIFALLLSFHLGKNQTHRASPGFFF